MLARSRLLLVLCLMSAALPAEAGSPMSTSSVRAGVAKVDSTWHVGAPTGQYAPTGVAVGGPGVDPSAHAVRRTASTGIQSREWVRALVVDGGAGKRWALISNDLYIPLDLVNRRVGSILRERDRLIGLGLAAGTPTGIDESNMTVSVSHSHSSTYQATPSVGVWVFQDAFDIRHYEHIAQAMADAVILAAADLRPVRMGANTVPFTDLKRHSFGPAIADDGTPAGYPSTDVDGILNVVRFDDITDPDDPTPLATWVILGLHPEMLDGNNLLTGEYVNTMYRFVDREIGGVTLFSQNDTGTAEPASGAGAHPPEARQEFSHKEYAQMERAARTVADAVETAWNGVAGCVTAMSGVCVPFASDFPVSMTDLRFAPPSARVTPTVSNCRTERAFDGDPGVPIAGLPDCRYDAGAVTAPVVEQLPFDPGVTYAALREAGIPVPDNTPGPSYGALQETVQVHLQAVRLGDVAVTVCPCEQWADQSRNIRSRIDDVSGNFWLGFDWTRQTVTRGGQPRDFCVPAGTGWMCADPGNTARDLPPVSDLAYRRMVAQINNDAAGWDALDNSLRAESEPLDPDEIKGNYTHEELDGFGYPLVITVGMSNDYLGYIATYREYQRGDHYRKALTGLGPHSSDFLATRLTRMAASLNGGPAVEQSAKDAAFAADDANQRAKAEALGKLAQVVVPAYEAQLPPDGGTPRVTAQPVSVERFDAARVSWVGGSNWTDTPHAKVQRLVDGAWLPFADGSGEVQVKATYPTTGQLDDYEAGTFEWVWQATFETFVSDLSLVDASGDPYQATPEGIYRFVVEGAARPARGTDAQPYVLVSEPFEVEAWSGITVSDLRREADGRASFLVGPSGTYSFPSGARETVGPIDYPDTYVSPFPFIRKRVANEGDNRKVYGGGHVELFCVECSFRPWLDAGAASSAYVTGGGPGGEVLEARLDVDGRYRTVASASPDQPLMVAAGSVSDRWGQSNPLPIDLP